jgi:Flp pilus assembly protein TadD
MRYALLFAFAILALTVVAVATFDRISAGALAASPPPAVSESPADTIPAAGVQTPVVPAHSDYERFAEDDRAWRARHARPYSAAELRARGDGKRTARETMEDRVFEYTRRGERARAVAELERWVRAHPRDEQALLSLARLLNEIGRTEDALARYRQILALHGGADR